MRNQDVVRNELTPGLAGTPTDHAAEPPSGEIPRKSVGATPVPQMRCDSRASEYFTKDPVFAPRKSRGQPPKLDASRKRFVAILVSLGLSLRQIARDLGIDHSTISRTARRDKAFAAALARAKEERGQSPQLGFRGWREAVEVLELHGNHW